MNKKAFTLAELLAVIAILGIIALIVFPAVNKTIKSSKEKAYNQQVESILESAENWTLENMSILSDVSDNYITIGELQQSGYLEAKTVINPLTDEEMNGCIIARYESNQFIYSYQENTCSELSVLPIITLNGESTITIGLGDTYTDPGVTASYNDTDISSSIVVSNNIDNTKVGTYQVRYNVTYNGTKAEEVIRTVKVIDDSPIITLTGDSTVTIGLNDTYVDVGASAKTYEGTDITSSIVVTSDVDTTTVGTYTVRYNVTYNGKSAKEVTRTVNVIDDSPIITLNGDSIVTLRLNETYTDAGASAKTYEGADITSSIVVTNDVDITTVGTYTVRYNVTYNGKSAKEVTRTVKVVDKSPIIVLSAYETSKYEKSVTIDVTVTPYTGNTISTLVYKLNGGTEQTVNNNQIVIDTEGDHTIEVISTDNEGNTGTITSGVYKIDTTSPTITFAEGDSAGITLKVSEVASYDLKTGVSVTDNTTITLDNVTVSGDLSAVIGEYTITYTATDVAGNTSTKTRKVTVINDPVTVTEKMESSSEVMNNDPDGNLRYVGADPDNYVWFNNELWRIIGVFNGQTKIIRNDFYSIEITWDTSGKNDWSTASLQQELNGTFLTSIRTNAPTSYSHIDVTHVWNIGGVSNANTLRVRASIYNLERGTTVSSGRPTTWTGAIGLMYPSDYGYAASGDTTTCDTTMSEWDAGTAKTECAKNSWLYNGSYYQWTLTPSSTYSSRAFHINPGDIPTFSGGNVHYKEVDESSNSITSSSARPALFLKSNVLIVDGTGDKEDPYILTQ